MVTLLIQQNADDDDAVKKRHEPACEEKLFFFVYRTVECPKYVERHKENPGRKREARTALRLIDLEYLRHEREWRKNTDTIHHIIKKSLPCRAGRKRFKTPFDERPCAKMMKTVHSEICFVFYHADFPAMRNPHTFA